MLSISKRVYMDDPAQPSRPGATSDATINVANQCHILFEEVDKRDSSLLKMTIRDPVLLGSTGYKESDPNTFFESVLTACNLHMEHMRLSTVAADTKPIEVHRDRPQDNVYIRRKPGKIEVTVKATVGVSSRATLALHSTERLDEPQVLDTVKMMHTIYADPNPSAKVANLRASLESYSHGIVSHHRDEVLKGLYAALENAVNFDEDVSGPEFDTKTRTLVGNHTLQIERIRKAYARLKHPASEKQLPDYPDRLAVFWFVKELRPTAAKAILLRLKEATGRP